MLCGPTEPRDGSHRTELVEIDCHEILEIDLHGILASRSKVNGCIEDDLVECRAQFLGAGARRHRSALPSEPRFEFRKRSGDRVTLTLLLAEAGSPRLCRGGGHSWTVTAINRWVPFESNRAREEPQR